MRSEQIQKQLHDYIVDVSSKNSISNNEIDNMASEFFESTYPLTSDNKKLELILKIKNEVNGFGKIEELLDDQTINEIMINSFQQVFVERKGKLSQINFEISKEELIHTIKKLAAYAGARCDVSSPILDAWTKNGSRIHAVLDPIAQDGPYLTIRKFNVRKYNLEDFINNNEEKEIVNKIISDKKNIIVAGSTSSGKTTFVNAVIDLIPKSERIISIEETPEIKSEHFHLVKLIARSANSEGKGRISLSDLVKSSLRMRPDRIVIGEVRSVEAFDLMQALNTGHGGSISTIHANGPQEVIDRLSSLAILAHKGFDYNAIVKQFYYGIDVIIFVKNIDGVRKVTSISEIIKTDIGHKIKNVLAHL